MTGQAVSRRIELRLNRHRLWRWQLELARVLAGDAGVRLTARMVDGPALPAALGLLLALEGPAYRLRGHHACDRLGEADFAQWRAAEHGADLILDFAGDAGEGAGPEAWHLRYDESPDDDALLAAALGGHPAKVTVVDGGGCIRASGYPAIEDPTVTTRALDTLFSGLLRIVLKALRSDGEAAAAAPPRRAAPSVTVATVLAAGAGSLAEKLCGRLTQLCRRPPNWSVAWRRIDPSADFSHLDIASYRPMPQDAGRYFADPFPIEVNGQTHLFVEEFPYATGKGIISVATLGEDGPSAARPVLETDVHLSYPHVFAHAGEIYMVPETMEADAVRLYRAERFPDRWVHEATLLDGIRASDATLIQRDGSWWMFVTTRAWWGSTWDSLNVFWADDLHGPWSPHPGNPVTVDCRYARPAGHFFEHAGALWRPAQDCSDGYGSGLAFCRVDRLDRARVEQSPQHLIRMRADGVKRGPHTFNRCGSLEAIDVLR